jgi:glycosyltransferase involved in cell wall biosynthesis
MPTGAKGSALREGFLHVQGDYVLIQDADDEYDPNDYFFLLSPIVEGKTEAVFGSRSMGGSNIPLVPCTSTAHSW